MLCKVVGGMSDETASQNNNIYKEIHSKIILREKEVLKKVKKVPYKNILITISSPGEIGTLKPVIRALLQNQAIKIAIKANHGGEPIIRKYLKDLLSNENLSERLIVEEIQKLDDLVEYNFDFHITSLFHHANQDYIDRSREKNIPVVGIVDLAVPEYNGKNDNFFKILYKLPRVVVPNELAVNKLKELQIEDKIKQEIDKGTKLIQSLIKNQEQETLKQKKQIEQTKISQIVDQIAQQMRHVSAETLIDQKWINRIKTIEANENRIKQLRQALQNYEKMEVYISADPKYQETFRNIYEFRSLPEFKGQFEKLKEAYYKENHLNICFSGQLMPNDQIQEEALAILGNSIEKILEQNSEAKINIIYLQHPREGNAEYRGGAVLVLDEKKKILQGLSDRFKNSVTITYTAKEEDAYKVVALADVHITQTSTLGVETAYADIPTLFIASQAHGIEALEDGAIIYTKDAEQICRFLRDPALLAVPDRIFSDLRDFVTLKYIRALGLLP